MNANQRADMPPLMEALPRPDGGDNPFGGGGRWQGGPRNQAPTRQPGGRPGGFGQAAEQQLQGLNIGHVNEKIKQFMTPYYRKFGARVNVMSLVQAAGINYRDLPYLNRYIRGGQNTLCYNHILGRCNFGPQCTRYAGHAEKRDVPDDFR